MNQSLLRCGKVKPVSAAEQSASLFGIGFEKNDRNLYIADGAYDWIAQIGVKLVRLQSGWMRTEKEPGVYDFAWLDELVDNLLARHLQPWITLCYGNPLYTPLAKEHFGAVGCPPIATEAEREAWRRYVMATVTHYKGRVDMFEVWNEPDGDWCWKTGSNGTEYGEFAARTCRAILDANPDAKPIVGSMCGLNLTWLTSVAAAGAFKDAWAFTYHDYDLNQAATSEKVRMLRALIARTNPAVKIIQGETGTQSQWGYAGAFNRNNWTEDKQAKYLLCQGVQDLLNGVVFSSYFSTLDMPEALNANNHDAASRKDFGYFGVLASNFNEEGQACGPYTPKKSFYAYQNLCAILHGKPTLENPAVTCRSLNSPDMGWYPEADYRQLFTGGFCRPDGSRAFVYWKNTNLLAGTVDETMSFDVFCSTERPKLIDPMTGNVYAIGDEKVEPIGPGSFQLKNLPLREYPLFLVFGDFCPVA